MAEWIFYPPLKAMSGGCMVLLQIARQLQNSTHTTSVYPGDLDYYGTSVTIFP
ncbi:MAG: hypothetical protein Q7J24_14050 [Desulfomicrobium sp.]|nr:hypothetical protein [Desulfomicrobium sp.]